jgi:hypothetical protein
VDITSTAFPDIVLWGQLRGGIHISTDRMTAVTRFPTLHLRFDMVLSNMPLQPQDPARMYQRNTWLVKVNHCPTRQVFIGVTTTPEHAIGSMNIARVFPSLAACCLLLAACCLLLAACCLLLAACCLLLLLLAACCWCLLLLLATCWCLCFL